MRRRSIEIAGTTNAGMAGDLHVGIWKLNLAKSKFTVPPPKSVTVVCTAQENGIKFVLDELSADGKAGHIELATTYDGKDYPITGMPNVDTISTKKIDANTFDHTFKKGGKEVGTEREVYSKDGKTLTRTLRLKNTQGQDVTTIVVYDRQ